MRSPLPRFYTKDQEKHKQKVRSANECSEAGNRTVLPTSRSATWKASANSGSRVIASPSTTLRINSAKQSLSEKEIASSPEAPRNDRADARTAHATPSVPMLGVSI